MRALIYWCAREPLEPTQARKDVVHIILTLLEKFWQELWTQRNLVVKAKPLYLVYHAGLATTELAKVGLEALAVEYIILWSVSNL